ncbi:MAG: DinB family protein [Candidatus Dormibacteraeota bacterium]|nr:DinB family protein [Candidatus Dormibacteraeota bacterium]
MTPKEVAARIDAAGTAIEAELGTMTDELASWHPAEGEWCVKEVLAHLTLSEAFGFAGRIINILSADEPQLKATGSAELACRLNLEHMLAEFRRQRARSIELVAGLQPWDLDRAGIHERVGRLTVNDLIHEWVHHDRAHLKQILANVQAHVWLQMGGAQAFVTD